MQKLKPYFKCFFYLISIIISMGITFYFINHNNLKKHIHSKSEYLKDNINRVEKKVDEFKQETKENLDKIDKKIDKLEKTIINQNKTNKESE